MAKKFYHRYYQQTPYDQNRSDSLLKFNSESLLQATSITRSTLSNDHLNDVSEGTSEQSGSSGSSKKRKNTSQKSKPKKRKLRSLQEEDDEGEHDENESKNSSRSRCF